jgi:hypothetical protein
MILSRRNFLGGAIAALTLRILPSPLAAREPRTWVWLDYDYMLSPRHLRIIVRWAGCRSDGTYFYVSESPFLQNTTDYSEHLEIHPEILQAKHDARIHLNSFLDSRCDCILGYCCSMHEYLKPRNIPPYVGEDKDRDEADAPEAIYEVITA